MKQVCTATAPGKLIIVGEYAVLEGGPAISAAVDRRARVELRHSSGGNTLRIANTGAVFPFAMSAGKPCWESEPGDYGRLPEAALTALSRGEVEQLPAMQIELSTEDFYSKSLAGAAQKIGIGSSAALTVALVAALQASTGAVPSLQACMDAHLRFQDGKGSGIDIATSWYGNVVAMQPQADALPNVEKLQWPSSFHVLPIWSGESASTPEMLSRLAAYRANQARAYARLMDELAACSRAALGSWHADNAAELLELLSVYGGLLEKLDEAGGIGIWSSIHQQLGKLALEFGVGYKPSGAGGGDFGLAFAADAELLSAFAARVDATLIAQNIALNWSAEGIKIAAANSF